MSTKIYDVYKFKNTDGTEPTIQDVFNFLQPIKKEVVKVYENEALIPHVIELHKAYVSHMNATPSEFEIIYDGERYTNAKENCVIYAHKSGLYIHFFLGYKFRELKERLFLNKNLEDFHYQNSTDRPENISEKEWSDRESLWDEILGHEAPSDKGFLYNFMTYRNFDLLMWRNALAESDKRRKENEAKSNPEPSK
jgi:hypothetical protein